MRHRSIMFFAAIAVLAGFAGSANAEELDLDFQLVNSTGYTIKEVYIAPNAVEEWGDNILKKKLKDGEVLEVSFHPKATAAKWDIRIVWEDDGKAVFWRGYKLTEIEKITLKYDEESGKTTAKTE